MILQSYLKTTYRNLLKNKLFSAVNIIGLALGMAVCLLVFEYTRHEKNYDTFQRNGDNIYRIVTDAYTNGNLVGQYAPTMEMVGSTLKAEFPGVVEAARLYDRGKGVIYEKKTLTHVKVFCADPAFLNLFPLPMVRGNPSSALQETRSAVISNSVAKRLFGDKDPIGEFVRFYIGPWGGYKITGIMKDVPGNSHLKLDILVSIHDIKNWTIFKGGENKWYHPMFQTYILLRPDADPKAFEAKLPAFLERYAGPIMKKYGRRVLRLQPLRDIHLGPGYMWGLGGKGNKKAVTIAFWGAIAILLFSLVNFVNLSSIGSMGRATEISIRKAVGANPMQLTLQFLTESFMLTFFASLAAIFLIYFFLPLFNKLSGMQFTYSLLLEPGFLLNLVLLSLFIILLSGIFMTLILASLNLKLLQEGKYGRYTIGVSLRNLLIVLQFVISVVLISGAYIMSKQINFMLNRDLGFSKEGILVLKPVTPGWGGLQKAFNFVEELKKIPGVKNAAFSSVTPGDLHHSNQEVNLQGESTNRINAQTIFIDDSYIDTFEIKLLAGRNFSLKFASDKNAVIINESLMRALGFQKPKQAVNRNIAVDKRMMPYIKPGEHRIVGVIKDYNQEPLRTSVKPTKIHLIPANKGNFAIKLTSTTGIREKLDLIRKKYVEFFYIDNYEYHFLDEFIDAQYKADVQFRRIIEIATFLAIFIACLGLLGLSSYISFLRTREIAIRKVIGASVDNIFLLLSRDFIIRIVTAIFIAVPIAYFGLHGILRNYAYRINLSWWLFFIPSAVVLIIAILTLSYQITRITKVNPAETLKYE